MKSFLRTPGRRAAAAVFGGASILFATLGGGATAVAFDQIWTDAATNTARCGLWDDAPGAGLGNDSGFVFAPNGAAGDELCQWQAAVPGISSSTFNQLRVRLAVNDSSRVTVRVLNNAAVTIGTATQTGNNQFVDLAVTLPGNQIIRAVVLTVDDNPDPAVASLRSSGLVDFIRIQNVATGAVGWQENFTRAL